MKLLNTNKYGVELVFKRQPDESAFHTMTLMPRASVVVAAVKELPRGVVVTEGKLVTKTA